jgi:hypothetical protein
MNVCQKILLGLFMLLSACAPPGAVPTFTAMPDWYDKVPAGQAQFPVLSTYWVADTVPCFSDAAKLYAYRKFEALKEDRVAEVAAVCTLGVTEVGGGPKIWLRNWARNQKIGNLEDRRGLVFLFRPDVPPEKDRLVLTKSDHLFYFTEVEWDPIMEAVSKYANVNRYDQALRTLADLVDSALRKQAPQYFTPTP